MECIRKHMGVMEGGISFISIFTYKKGLLAVNILQG